MRPNNGGVTKDGKQEVHINKGRGAHSEKVHQRKGEPDVASSPGAVTDDATVAAQRALTTLNAAINRAENSGKDVSDLKARAAELDFHLSHRDDTPDHISAEASKIALDVIEGLPEPPARPIDFGRSAKDTQQRKSGLESESGREADIDQPNTSHTFPCWFSAIALAVSLAALLLVPFTARAAVRKTLRDAGLI